MSASDKIQLRGEQYDPTEVRRLLDAKNCGAVLTFDGIMKEFLSDGTRVVRLDWDVYEAMAKKTLLEIREKAIRRFELQDLVLFHRLDAQLPGDLIMTLAVSAKRRKAAIEAVAWFMEKLKELAPLWKKETLFHGGERWVGQQEPGEKAHTGWPGST